jgi:hypothetical protein
MNCGSAVGSYLLVGCQPSSLGPLQPFGDLVVGDVAGDLCQVEFLLGRQLDDESCSFSKLTFHLARAA